MSFYTAILGQRDAKTATAEQTEAVRAIRVAVPRATNAQIIAFLDSEFGRLAAVEVLNGRSMTTQLEIRTARFLRNFEKVCRNGS